MRIAMAIEHFSVHRGGAESYAVELARSLVSRGWEVHLYGHSWEVDPSQAIFHAIPELPRWVPPSIRILHFASRHRALVLDQGFDVVLGFGNTLVMNVYQSHGGVHRLSSLRKIKAVPYPALRVPKRLGLWSTPKYHARAWIESAPFRMLHTPIVVAISDMVKDDIVEHFGISPSRIKLVYNGINTSRFGKERDPERRKAFRERLGFDDEVLFLFMAYDFRKKGVGYLIDAAGKLSADAGPAGFRVVVVGGAPSRALERQVRRLGLERIVTFHSATKEPETYYEACDVFVLPTFYDACSLVVFEAMAAGLPVITTVFNGAAGILGSGRDGLVIQDPADTGEMAGAMGYFLDRQVLASSSAAARKTASRYTLEHNHQQMIAIFDEAARTCRFCDTYP